MYSDQQHQSSAKPAMTGVDTYSDDDDETAGLLAAQTAYPKISSDYGVQECPDSNSIEVEMKDLATDAVPTQSSIVTIFSMWNTMMGTSLLSMPWAIKQAGFVNGIILLLVMAGIMAYTSYRVLKACTGPSSASMVINDFSDAVRVYFGKVSEAISLICSLLAFLGGAIVYWILMSNFLYHIVVFVYHKTHHDSPSTNGTGNFSHHRIVNPAYEHVVCGNNSENRQGQSDLFKALWSEAFTVPLVLVLLLFPLINFKSPTFFTKFNAFGTISVIYLLVFVIVKASQWGINLDFTHKDDQFYSPNFSWTFPALTGVAALAYFLHNAAMSIVRNQKHPENNTRDLIIAYALVCFTYTFMGAMFYAAFPMKKSCVEDNLLNNLASEDIMAFVARCCLLFQMTCVIPLIIFVLRSQLLYFFFGRVWPGRVHVVILNAVVVTLCVLFAMFLPNIGHIISFVGAFCGFSYAIAFPCGVFIMACYRNGTLTWLKIAIHGALIAIGLANFLAQFVILGDIS